MLYFKKFAALVLALAMALTLTGCLSGEESIATEATSAEAESTPASQDAQSEPVTEPAGEEYDPTKPFDASAYCDDLGFYKDLDYSAYVQLADLENITVPYVQSHVSDEEVDASVQRILENNAETVQVKDRAVADGDTLNIDYVGSVDGVEFAGGSTQGNGTTVTIGVTSYIDDFLEQLIGHMPGENFDIEVTFPDPYPNNSDLAGKDAIFNITINYIEDKRLPELTDAWVEEHYGQEPGWHTVDEMLQYIADTMQKDMILDYLSGYITDNSTLTSEPDVAREYWTEYTKWYVKYLCAQYGVTEEEYYANQGVASFDEMFEKMGETISTQIRYEMSVQAAAKALGYEPTEDEIKAHVDDYYGPGYYEYSQSNVPRSTMMKSVISELVLRHIAESVTIEDAPAGTLEPTTEG